MFEAMATAALVHMRKGASPAYSQTSLPDSRVANAALPSALSKPELFHRSSKSFKCPHAWSLCLCSVVKNLPIFHMPEPCVTCSRLMAARQRSTGVASVRPLPQAFSSARASSASCKEGRAPCVGALQMVPQPFTAPRRATLVPWNLVAKSCSRARGAQHSKGFEDVS